jgi:hypothetical protein
VDLLDEVEKGFDAVKKGLFWSIMDKVSFTTSRQRTRFYDEGKGGAALTARVHELWGGAQSLLEDERYLELIRKDDGEEYHPNKFQDARVSKFKMFLLTGAREPNGEQPCRREGPGCGCGVQPTTG